MEPFFSIIMPAYEVANYIGRAIDSVINQLFADWELIVIDDCSTDETSEIIRRYVSRDHRIRMISHDINRGLSAARNTGLKYAKGQYIWFMDSDDYVDNNLLKMVYESLKKSYAEVVVFGLKEEYYDDQENLVYTHEICPAVEKEMNQNQLRREIIKLEQQTLYGYAWNKIYEKRYLKKINLRFSDEKLIEDIKFNVYYFMDIEHMNLLKFAPYHYYKKRTRKSLTNSFVSDYYLLHEKRIQMILDLYIYWKMDIMTVRSTLGALYGRYVLSSMQRNCDKNSGMNLKKRMNWCRWVFNRRIYNELIPIAKAENSTSLGLVLNIFKKKNLFLCILMGRIIYIINNFFPLLYSRGKEGR